MSTPIRNGWAAAGPLVVASLFSSGCIGAPYTDTVLANSGESVRFSGFTFTAGQTVSLRSSASETGSFVEFATAVTSVSPITLVNGDRLYSWQANAVVPGWGGTACEGQDVYVRAYAGPFTSQVYDDAASINCISDAVNDGEPTLVAMVECASEDSPNLHLSTAPLGGPTSHVGDITITTPADVEDWACLEQLTGDLSIPDSTVDVGLPHLESVTGDVALTFTRLSNVFLPELRGIDLSALETIGGSLAITSPATNPSQNVSMNVGLDALASLGGDLTISAGGFGVDVSGIDGLTTLPGALSITTGNGDTGLFALSGLVSAGSVHLDLGFNVFGGLDVLTTVTGDFVMNDGNIYASDIGGDNFETLTTVGGDFVLENAQIWGPGAPTSTIFVGLTSVGGTLTYRNNPGNPALQFGAPSLSVGGLEVETTPALTSVGGSNITVAPSGTVEFSNNVNLCTSAVTAYAATLPGWSGMLVNLGNAAC